MRRNSVRKWNDIKKIQKINIPVKPKLQTTKLHICFYCAQ